MITYFEDAEIIVKGNSIIYNGKRIPISSIKRASIRSGRIPNIFFIKDMIMINDPMILVLDLGLFRKEIVAEAPLAGNIYGAFVHLSKSEKNDPEFKYIYTEYSKMYKQRIHETEIHKLEAEIHKLLRANPNINKYKLDSLISRVLSYQRLNNVLDAIVKAMAAI